tara:strand:+ start:1144 stop:1743 length:600 start_codon:yes stop_codon:yes gene_type:complete
MAYYPILPHPTYDECDFATWEDGFTQEECDKIIQLGESSKAQTSTVGGDPEHQDTNTEIRKSLNSWIGLNNDSEWIYQRLSNISRCLNGLHWRFDISCFSEDLQYTRYNSDGCFYGWHIDNGVKGSEHPQRKLSITLQLSDGDEYEGGDFQIHSSKLSTLPKKKGLIVAFPSYSLHQVTPVTSGSRKSLVVWLCGKPFQ